MGVGSGVGVGVGSGVAVGVDVGVGVAAGVGLGVAVGAGVAAGVGLGVAVGAGVADGEGEGVAVDELLETCTFGEVEVVVVVDESGEPDDAVTTPVCASEAAAETPSWRSTTAVGANTGVVGRVASVVAVVGVRESRSAACAFATEAHAAGTLMM